jgi:hypothetical protein|tara:strand:+ start:207 stop:392 length:186 start_codon:yes stop_codon:yes gene_type:complete
MKNSKFKKGQKVSYLGNKAEVRSLNWCIYAEDFVYNVKYRNENNTRCGVTTYENEQTLKAR